MDIKKFNLINQAPTTNIHTAVTNANAVSSAVPSLQIDPYRDSKADYFANTDLSDAYRLTQEKYQNIRDRYAEFYHMADDPSDKIEQEQLASFLHNIYPEYSKQFFLDNAEQFMYQATGFKADVKTYGEHLGNVWKSASSSLNASFGVLGLMTKYAGDYESLEYQNERDALLKSIDYMATDYRKDVGDERYDLLIQKMLSGTWEQLPHTVVTGGLGALEAISAIIPITRPASLMVHGVRKVVDFAFSGMMEGGGLMLEMLKAGYDPTVVLTAGVFTGIINGALEMYADDVILSPISNLTKELTDKNAKKVIKTGIDMTIAMLKEMATSMVTEPIQEVAEEFVGMYAQNIALAYEHEHNRMEDTTKYTKEDFVKTAREVARATMLSTPLMTLGSNIVGAVGSRVVGDWGNSVRATKYVDPYKTQGAKIIQSSDIAGVYFDKDKMAQDKFATKKELKKNKTSAPIVYNVLGRYYGNDNSREQTSALMHAKGESKGVILADVREAGVFTNLNDEQRTRVSADIKSDLASGNTTEITKGDIDMLLEEGMNNKEIAGASFLDKEGNVTDSKEDAVAVAVTKKSNPESATVFELVNGYRDESERVTAVNEASKSLYGKVFAVVKAQNELKDTVVPKTKKNLSDTIKDAVALKKLKFTEVDADSSGTLKTLQEAKKAARTRRVSQEFSDVIDPKDIDKIKKELEGKGFEFTRLTSAGEVAKTNKGTSYIALKFKDGSYEVYKVDTKATQTKAKAKQESAVKAAMAKADNPVKTETPQEDEATRKARELKSAEEFFAGKKGLDAPKISDIEAGKVSKESFEEFLGRVHAYWEDLHISTDDPYSNTWKEAKTVGKMRDLYKEYFESINDKDSDGTANEEKNVDTSTTTEKAYNLDEASSVIEGDAETSTKGTYLANILTAIKDMQKANPETMSEEDLAKIRRAVSAVEAYEKANTNLSPEQKSIISEIKKYGTEVDEEVVPVVADNTKNETTEKRIQAVASLMDELVNDGDEESKRVYGMAGASAVAHLAKLVNADFDSVFDAMKTKLTKFVSAITSATTTNQAFKTVTWLYNAMADRTEGMAKVPVSVLSRYMNGSEEDAVYAEVLASQKEFLSNIVGVLDGQTVTKIDAKESVNALAFDTSSIEANEEVLYKRSDYTEPTKTQRKLSEAEAMIVKADRDIKRLYYALYAIDNYIELDTESELVSNGGKVGINILNERINKLISEYTGNAENKFFESDVRATLLNKLIEALYSRDAAIDVADTYYEQAIKEYHNLEDNPAPSDSLDDVVTPILYDGSYEDQDVGRLGFMPVYNKNTMALARVTNVDAFNDALSKGMMVYPSFTMITRESANLFAHGDPDLVWMPSGAFVERHGTEFYHTIDDSYSGMRIKPVDIATVDYSVFSDDELEIARVLHAMEFEKNNLKLVIASSDQATQFFLDDGGYRNSLERDGFEIVGSNFSNGIENLLDEARLYLDFNGAGDPEKYYGVARDDDGYLYINLYDYLEYCDRFSKIAEYMEVDLGDYWIIDEWIKRNSPIRDLTADMLLSLPYDDMDGIQFASKVSNVPTISDTALPYLFSSNLEDYMKIDVYDGNKVEYYNDEVYLRPNTHGNEVSNYEERYLSKDNTNAEFDNLITDITDNHMTEVLRRAFDDIIPVAASHALGKDIDAFRYMAPNASAISGVKKARKVQKALSKMLKESINALSENARKYIFDTVKTVDYELLANLVTPPEGTVYTKLDESDIYPGYLLKIILANYEMLSSHLDEVSYDTITSVIKEYEGIATILEGFLARKGDHIALEEFASQYAPGYIVPTSDEQFAKIQIELFKIKGKLGSLNARVSSSLKTEEVTSIKNILDNTARVSSEFALSGDRDPAIHWHSESKYHGSVYMPEAKGFVATTVLNAIDLDMDGVRKSGIHVFVSSKSVDSLNSYGDLVFGREHKAWEKLLQEYGDCITIMPADSVRELVKSLSSKEEILFKQKRVDSTRENNYGLAENLRETNSPFQQETLNDMLKFKTGTEAKDASWSRTEARNEVRTLKAKAEEKEARAHFEVERNLKEQNGEDYEMQPYSKPDGFVADVSDEEISAYMMGMRENNSEAISVSPSQNVIISRLDEQREASRAEKRAKEEAKLAGVPYEGKSKSYDTEVNLNDIRTIDEAILDSGTDDGDTNYGDAIFDGDPVVNIDPKANASNVYSNDADRDITNKLNGIIAELEDEMYDDDGNVKEDVGSPVEWVRNKIIELSKKCADLEIKFGDSMHGHSVFEKKKEDVEIELVHRNKGKDKNGNSYNAGDLYKDTRVRWVIEKKSDDATQDVIEKVEKSYDEYMKNLIALTYLVRAYDSISKMESRGESYDYIMDKFSNGKMYNDFINGIEGDDYMDFLFGNPNGSYNLTNSLPAAIGIEKQDTEMKKKIQEAKAIAEATQVEKTADGKYKFKEDALYEAIYRSAGGARGIGKRSAKFVAKLFSNLKPETQDKIIRKALQFEDDGLFFLDETEGARIGINLEGAEGAFRRDKMRLALSKDAKLTTVLHEAFHVIMSVDEDTRLGVYKEFRKAVIEDFSTLKKFIRDHASDMNFMSYKPGAESAEAIIGYLQKMVEYDSLDDITSKKGNKFLENNIHEAMTSVFEMWCMSDKRTEGLSSKLTEFFSYIKDVFNKVYEAVTGVNLNSYLNKNIEDRFFGMFTGESAVFYLEGEQSVASKTQFTRTNRVTATMLYNNAETREDAINFGAYEALSEVDISDLINRVVNATDSVSPADIVEGMLSDGEISGFEHASEYRRDVAQKVADMVQYAVNSPTTYAKALSECMANINDEKTQMNALNLLGELINGVIEHTRNGNEILDRIGKTLPAAQRKTFETLVRMLDKNQLDMTEDVSGGDINAMLRQWITDDGKLKLSKELVDDKWYTSPLIEMCIYANGGIDNQVDFIDNPFAYADADYLYATQTILETNQNTDKRTHVTPSVALVESAGALRRLDPKRFASILGETVAGEMSREEFAQRLADGLEKVEDNLRSKLEKVGAEDIARFKDINQMVNGLVREFNAKVRGLNEKIETRGRKIATQKEMIRVRDEAIKVLEQENRYSEENIRAEMKAWAEQKVADAIQAHDDMLQTFYEGMVAEIEKAHDAEIKGLESTISVLEKEVADAKEERDMYAKEATDRLNEVIDKHKEEVASLKEEIEEVREWAKQAIAENDPENLRRKLSNAERRIATLQDQLNALREDILARDEFVASHRYKIEREKLLNKLQKAVDVTDARDAERMGEVIKALRNGDISTIDPESWTDPAFTDILNWAVNAGIMKTVDKDGETSIVVASKLGKLLNSELQNFIDVVSKSVEALNKRYDERIAEEKRKKQEKWDHIKALISGDITGNSKMDEKIRATIMNRMVGSNEDIKSNRKFFGGVISEYMLMTQMVRRYNPALYAYLFGGNIAGEYNNFNLNTATNNEMRETGRRISAFNKAFANAFGIEEKDIKYKIDELANGTPSKLGYVTQEDAIRLLGLNLDKIDYTDSSEKYVALREFIYTINKEAKDLPKMIVATEEKLTHNIKDSARKTLEKRLKTYQDRLEVVTNFLNEGDNASDSTYTKQAEMGIYIAMQNKKELQHLLHDEEWVTNNLSLGNVLSVAVKFETDKAYAPYKQMADFMLKDMEAAYPRMNDVYYRTENKILHREYMYFPIYHDRNASDFNPEMHTKMFYDAEGHINESNLKARGGKGALSFDVLANYENNVKRQEHYIAFKELMDEYDDAFNLEDKDSLGSYIVGSFGDDVGKGREFVETLHSKYLSTIKGYRQFDDSATGALARTFRNKFQSAKLWLNLSTVAQQVPTLFLAVRHAGFKNVMHALTEYLGNQDQWSEFVYSKSEQMKNRKRLDIEVINAQRRANRNVIDDYLDSKWDKGSYKLREVNARLMDFGMNLMETVDSGVSNIMWLAIYNNIYEQKSGEWSDEAIANEATQLTLDMISNSNAKDNALAYSNPDHGIKSMLMFTNQLTKQANMFFNDMLMIDKDNLFETLKPVLESTLLLGIAATGAVLISGEALPDKEDEMGWEKFFPRLAGKSAINMLEMVPVVGKLLEGAERGFSLDTSLIGRIGNLAKVLAKDKEDRSERQLGNAIAQTIASSLDMTTGYGSTLITKGWRSMKAIADDKNIASALMHQLNYNYGNYFTVGR